MSKSFFNISFDVKIFHNKDYIAQLGEHSLFKVPYFKAIRTNYFHFFKDI